MNVTSARDAGVELHLYGHEHNFARSLPVYNRRVSSGTDEQNPHNELPGPVHVIAGSGVCFCLLALSLHYVN